MLATIRTARPELLHERAKAGIFLSLQAEEAPAKIGLRNLLSFANTRHDCDGFVIGFLVFGDEHRVAKVRFRLQRNRKSVVGPRKCSFGGWHDHIDRSVQEHKQDNSARYREKSPMVKRGAVDDRSGQAPGANGE